MNFHKRKVCLLVDVHKLNSLFALCYESMTPAWNFFFFFSLSSFSIYAPLLVVVLSSILLILHQISEYYSAALILRNWAMLDDPA